MQFSTFQKNLDNWQGASLIFGVLEEEIASQLEKIKFVINPKLLINKVVKKKFKGEKGKSLSFEFLDQKLETLYIVGLGKEVKLRRKLEQQLIYLWLPPFNKETRNRWSTTFTNN